MSPRRAKAVRGRVGEDPATALRAHLIDTAERLLAGRQIAAITTRDIARAAGVSDGVLYNYFADKNDLLLAALLRRFETLAGRFVAELPRPGTATVESNLHTFARALLDLGAEAIPTGAGLLNEPHLLHRFLHDIHQPPANPQRYHQYLLDYLTEERQLGRLGAGTDPEAATTLLMGATMMLALTGMVQGHSHAELTARLPAVVKALIHGLGGPPVPVRQRSRSRSGDGP